MNWIKDREPKSSGMYAVRLLPTNELKSFTFGYFDGTGWKIPSQSGEELSSYHQRIDWSWSTIDWGLDKEI
jgi:hypothetical protein